METTSNQIHVGLEIGTSKVCVCVSEGMSDGTLRVLGVAVAPSRGVRKGQIVDSVAAAECIRMAIQEAEASIGIAIKKVSVAFAGSDIFSTRLRRSRIQRSLDCVKSIQLEVVNLVPNSLACATALLTDRKESPGVLVIDLGGGTSDYCLASGDVFEFSGVLAVGGDHITNDISIGLRVPIARAECLKIQEGSAKLSEQSVRETIMLKRDHGIPDYEIDRKSLDTIIHLRVRELFEQIRDEIAFNCEHGTQINHFEYVDEVVLTGGASKLQGIAELAAKVFKVPVKLDHARCVSGSKRIIENPVFTTAIGITKFAMEAKPNSSVPSDCTIRIIEQPKPPREFHTNAEYLSALRKESDPGKNLAQTGVEDLDIPTFLRKGTDGVEIKHARKIE